MQKVLKRLKNLYARNGNGVVAITILLAITKLFGFLKFPLIAGVFQTTRELDIFWAAFLIPDTLFAILITGSILGAIIPIFAGVMHNQGPIKLARLYVVSLFTISLFILLLSVTGFVYADKLAEFVNIVVRMQHQGAGQSFTGSELLLLTRLIKVMVFTTLFLSMSMLTTAYLQIYKKFMITNLGPLFYNLGMAVSIVIFVIYGKMGVRGLAWAALVGSILHLGVQLPFALSIIRRELKQKESCFVSVLFGSSQEIVYSLHQMAVMLRLGLPRMVASVFEYVNVFVITAVSFSLRRGALSAYKYAYSIHLFPTQIFGSAISQIALPKMATDYASKNSEAYIRSFNKALLHTLFLIMPISVLVFVLRLPLVRLILGYGRFDWHATQLTSWALGLFAFAITAEAVIGIFLRALYARHNTRIPLYVASVSIFFNIVFVVYFTNIFSNFDGTGAVLSAVYSQFRFVGTHTITLGEFNKWLVHSLYRATVTRGDSATAVGGLAFAFSMTYFVEMLLLGYFIDKKYKIMSIHDTYRPIIKITGDTIIAGLVMYVVLHVIDSQLSIDTVPLLMMTIVVVSAAGAAVYFIIAGILGIRESEEYFGILRKLKGRFI